MARAEKKEMSEEVLIMVKARDDESMDQSGSIKYGERMNERCILEVESTEHANMGLREKEESIMMLGSSHEQLGRW